MFPSFRPGHAAPGFQQRSKTSIVTAGLIFLFAAALGCARAKPQTEFKGVAAAVAARQGPRVIWRQEAAEDRDAAKAVAELLQQPLNPDGAVQVALLNNPALQATYENLGIAQADLVQAGLLSNPVFGASARRRSPGRTATAIGFSLTQNFLDLLLRPLRKRTAQAELERTRLRVAHEVFELEFQVRRDFYTLQADLLLMDRLGAIVQSNEAAAEIARRQQAAGTQNELGAAVQQSFLGQSQLEALQLKNRSRHDREALNRDMGLMGSGLAWNLSPELAELPAHDPPLQSLEERAIAGRLDLAADRAEIRSQAAALRRDRHFRYLGRLDLGAQSEKPLEAEPGAPRLSGPEISLELPIFDRGQGRVPRAYALLRQAQDRYRSREIGVRSEVREAQGRLAASREMAALYTDSVLPVRRRVVAATLQQYNAMLKGVYDLILAKQAELEAERGYAEALRDYWISRAELERAIGGPLPGAPASPAPNPLSPPAKDSGASRPPKDSNG